MKFIFAFLMFLPLLAVASEAEVFTTADLNYLLKIIPQGTYHGYDPSLNECVVTINAEPGIYHLSMELLSGNQEADILLFTNDFGGDTVEKDFRIDQSWTVVTNIPAQSDRSFDTSLVFQKNGKNLKYPNYLVYLIGHSKSLFKCNIVVRQ